MVRHHPMARAERPVRRLPRRLGARLDDRPEGVGVVVVVHPLHDGGEALQPHAGVDGGPRQGRAHARRPFLVLHEHEVPDLDEAVAVLVRAARRPARYARPVVVEDLGARPARPGVAHAPEIVAGGDADDPLLGQARDLPPIRRRVVVLGEHRHQQPVARDGEVARQQLPGVGDRLLLEVVAEGEIPQHLEEGVVPRGEADIVEVVVLAAGAHAFLRRGGAVVGPPLLPGEDVLELHHAAVGEHQGRIVARHQRRAFHHRVPVAREVVEEGGADVVAAAAGHRLGGAHAVPPARRRKRPRNRRASLPRATGRVEVTQRRGMLRRFQPHPIGGTPRLRHDPIVVGGAPPVGRQGRSAIPGEPAPNSAANSMAATGRRILPTGPFSCPPCRFARPARPAAPADLPAVAPASAGNRG